MKFCVSCGEPVETEAKEETAGSDETQSEAAGQATEPEASEPQEDLPKNEPNKEELGNRAQALVTDDAGEDRMPERAGDDAGAPEEDRMPSNSAEQIQETDLQPKADYFVPSEQEAAAQQIPPDSAGPAQKKNAPMLFAAVAVAVFAIVVVIAVVVTRQSPAGSTAINASVTPGATSSQEGGEKENVSTDASSQGADDKAKQEAEEKAKKEAEEKARQEAEVTAKAEEEARKAEEEKRAQAVADAQSRGMQVFTGTVMVGTFKEIAEYEGGQSLTVYSLYGRKPNDTAAILILDSPQSVLLESFGSSFSEEVSHFSLAIDDSGTHYQWPYGGAVDQWEQFDGKQVVVAGNPTIPAGETFPLCPLLYNAEFLYAE